MMDVIILSELAKSLQIPKDTINPSSTFYQIGGDSMIALAVSASCRRQGVSVDVPSILRSGSISEILRNAKLLPTQPVNTVPKGDLKPVNNISEAELDRPAGFHHSSTKARQYSPTPTDLRNAVGSSRGNGVGSCSMAKLQSVLVLDTKARPGNNVISYFQEYSPGQIPTLKRAWQKVIQSEPIFRAVFDDDFFLENGMACFVWSENIHRDLCSFEEHVESIKAPEMVEPATEFEIITLAGKRSIVVWHVHHALVDGYSARLLLQKVCTLMEGGQITEGRSFLELSRAWQMYQAIFEGQARQFWQDYLSKVTDNDFLLPPPCNQSSNNSLSANFVAFSVPLQRIIRYSSEKNLPLSSIYYAAWSLVLAIYTGSDTVSFGIVFENRSIPIPGIRETVGPMMNTLPLILHLDRGTAFKDLLLCTTQRVAKLREFEWSTPDQSPKMTSVLAMQYDYEAVLSPTSSTMVSSTRLQSSIPINIFLGPKEKIQINYDKVLFDHSDIEDLVRMYVNAIETLIGPEGTLDWYFRHSLTPELLQQSLLNGNCFSDATLGQGEDTLTSLFDACVKSAPDSVAVARGDESLTYAQLDAAATKIASSLCEIVLPQEVICVHADRSINWIIAIYAVLKAQAVYCPLDPASPDDLRDSYFRTSGSRVYISPFKESKARKPSSCSLFYSIEELLYQADNTPGLVTRYGNSIISKKDLAYLCFTSGSSGLPKGVVCTHEGIVAFQKDYNARLHMRPGLQVAQVMSPAFDGSMHEIFSCLSYGGTLLLSHKADVLGNIQQANVAMITPSIGKMLNPCDHKNLEAIYLVGEQLPQAVCDAWSATVPAYNMYGPTESSCGSSYKRLVHGEIVTIGKPVESTRIYILDQHQNLLPPGVIGELYTAGVQVSPGYIQRPDETAKNFLKDIIRPETGQMMYRTQDRGYWNRSGEICLLGRSDRQIKLRGFRLDLNDLEIRMVANTEATSVAIARKDDILVAMIQPETTNIALFKETIKKVLPPQAIPRLIKAVDTFPLANAGKIDYKAVAAAFCASIPRVSSHGRPVSPVSTPADAREAIATVWRTLLKLEDGHVLDDNSNFIELGGHSIKQITLSKRLSSILDRDITLADVIENIRFGDQVNKFLPAYSESSGSQSPLIESAATTPAVGIRDQISSIWQSLLSLDREYPLNDDSNFIELGGDSVLLLNLASRLTCLGGRHIALHSVIKRPCLGDQISLFSSSKLGSVAEASKPEIDSKPGCLSLSPIEREWVEKYKVGKGSSSFNVNYACALSGDTDIIKLEEIWNKVLKRHEILSSLFPNEHTRSYAKVPPQVAVVGKIDIREEVNREFKLDEEHPIRVFITPTTFLLVASHIVLDLTALNVILRDIEICWGGKILLPLQRTYSQTAQWSRDVSQDDLDFWKSLSEVPCYREPLRLSYNGTSRVCKIPLETFQGMVQFTVKHSITLHQLSLAAVALALYPTGTHDQLAVLGAPYLNRGVEDFDTVGLFLEPLPIRIKVPRINRRDSMQQHISPRETWSHAFAKSVGKASQDALSHAIPWNRLLEYLDIQPQHPNVPFIEAMVTFHDNRGQKASAIPGTQQLYTWCEGSKFKLMFEFSAIGNETLMLRIEYDNMIYNDTKARNFQRRTIAALEAISQGFEQEKLVELIQTAMDRQSSEGSGNEYFSVSLVNL